MNIKELENILNQVRSALLENNLAGALKIIELLRPADQAELFSELDDQKQIALLTQLEPDVSADILEEMDEENAANLISSMPDKVVTPIVDEMEPDEAADLLGNISHDQAETILTSLKASNEVKTLLGHPENSAGGLMTSDYLAFQSNLTASQAILLIRHWKKEIEETSYVFIVDIQEHLIGIASLYKVIEADPTTVLFDIMDPDVISVREDTDQEECAKIMARYDLVVLPVVDINQTFLGIITFDDIIDVVEDEATEDFQRLGGAEPLEGSYLSTGVFSVFKKRIGWLMLLFITETLTGTVLRFFESELKSAVALSFFVPLLIGTGGNAGSQTTSTIIRALAVDDIDWNDIFRSLWHELRIGLMLGIGMSAIAYIRALSWGSSTSLSVTVALAIFIIVLWANGLGALLPILATRLGIDPTVVSGPVMSTLVDATGLFIYFTIARAILGL